MEKYYINEYEAGLDEAGRGPLIGNVYAAAVIWTSDLNPPINLIKDSKKLSIKKRNEAYNWIINNVKNYGIGYSTNKEIDEINILEATKLAMDRALNNLSVKPDILIIDGLGWEKKFVDYNVHSIIKGDNKYYSIAAASILAKINHDLHINLLCDKNNELNTFYDLKKNNGYPTKKHIEGIKNYGLTEYHRITYKIKSI